MLLQLQLQWQRHFLLNVRISGCVLPLSLSATNRIPFALLSLSLSLPARLPSLNLIFSSLAISSEHRLIYYCSSSSINNNSSNCRLCFPEPEAVTVGQQHQQQQKRRTTEKNELCPDCKSLFCFLTSLIFSRPNCLRSSSQLQLQFRLWTNRFLVCVCVLLPFFLHFVVISSSAAAPLSCLLRKSFQLER